MVNPTGYTALDLIGFTDKGAYAANVNYVKNDLVHHGGNIWRILIDDTIGITPAEGPNYTVFVGEPINLVERIIAPLEVNPATVAYQTGRQIIYNDHLYEVIQNIGIGDILIAYEDDPTNANIKLASPVETQVLALNASKVNKSDVVNNVTTTTAGKVLDARQGKALQDAINTKINKSDIANNVTTTAKGKVLDARQGKVLQDGINTKINKSDIANNVTTTAEGKVLDARQGKVLQDGKTDNSVIAPVESGTTASRAYAAGAHFIKNGAFCTAKTAIAQGETFTLNTNYTVGTVEEKIYNIEHGWGPYETLHTENYGNLYGRVNEVLKIAMIVWGGNTNTTPTGSISIAIPQKYTPSNGVFVVPIKTDSSTANNFNMSVRYDGFVQLTLPGTSWSAGYIMYPTV